MDELCLRSNQKLWILIKDCLSFLWYVLYSSWGLIGDATPTGWDSDTDMVWDADRGVLTLTVDLNPGFIKFRANDAWDLNFGDDFTNGTLENNGSDIPIDEAGNYTIDLILDVADYTYTVTKN